MNHKIDIPFQKCKARNIHAGIVHSRLKRSVSRSDSRNPLCLFGCLISSPQTLMAFQVHYKTTDSKNQPTNVGVKSKKFPKNREFFRLYNKCWGNQAEYTENKIKKHCPE